MQIQWNKVTWYSKAIALALFIVVPCLTFVWGAEYGALVAMLNNAPRQASTTTVASAPAIPPYYQNVAEWQTDQDSAGGFSISYPVEFDIDENYLEAKSTGWAYDPELNNTSGVQDLGIVIPSLFQPQTNFANATLTVGRSDNAMAVSNCLQIPESYGVTSTSTAMINGISFLVFTSNSAGAGNLYETTGYYALHGGQCYAIEYTIHSIQIGNYPASYNLQPFNEAMVTDVLNRIVGTFKFE